MLWLALLFSCVSPEPEPEGEADPSAEPIAPYDPLVWVDPFMGTGGTGAEIINVNPGPTLPWGMVHPGADTRATYGAPSFYHCAGYHYVDEFVGGFSHTHALGIGIADFGAITLMPRDGWSDDWRTDNGRQAPFSHDQEAAEAGYYQVDLLDQDIGVEVTATQRAVLWRFSFAEGADPIVVFDLGQSLSDNNVSASALEIDEATGEISGVQNLQGSYSNRFGGLLTHFSAVPDVVPVGHGTWNGDGATVPGSLSADGEDVGGWIQFPAGTTEVLLRVGISYVDVDGARNNRGEVDGRSFDEVREGGATAWRDLLSTVRIRGATDGDHRIFTNALYRASIMPRRYDDADGRYRGVDDAIHTTEVPYYSDFSLWDTFRTLHPWMMLWRPDLQAEMNASLITMTDQGGALPRWPMAHGFTGGMVGTPATQVLAESWLKGIREGWDADKGYEAALAAARGPVPRDGRDGIEGYVELGWVPFGEAGSSASKTLEYAWSDGALAGWAEARGDAAVAAEMKAQSQSWRNQWDPAQQLVVGRRRDGTFAEVLSGSAFDPEHFTEGNAWHYRWGAAHDVEGIVDLEYGGDPEAFSADLRAYWEEVRLEEDDNISDDWYWHGNEPVLHYAFLGSLAGDADVTADAARLVLATRHEDSVTTIDGNDDGGTLSAWYLLAATGVYPVAGTTTWAVGSPIFERVEIDRPDGKTLVVRAPGTSDAVRYPDRVLIGGEPISGATFDDAAWMAGEELFFELR